jgi:hypothetical protein
MDKSKIASSVNTVRNYFSNIYGSTNACVLSYFIHSQILSSFNTFSVSFYLSLVSLFKRNRVSMIVLKDEKYLEMEEVCK